VVTLDAPVAMLCRFLGLANVVSSWLDGLEGELCYSSDAVNNISETLFRSLQVDVVDGL
jgi:hypothetical protein